MSLGPLLSKLWRWYGSESDGRILKLDLEVPVAQAGENIVSMDRPLSEQERSIAKWLLLHAEPSAYAFLPQLDVACVSGHCRCGCPTVHLSLPEGTSAVEPMDNPVGDAIGEVNGKMVGVMLLQNGGYLECLEIYDLSDIEHPYGLPDLSSLRSFEAAQ